MINSDFSPLWISLKTAVIATIITFFLGLKVAYWMFNYRGKFKGIIDAVLISPLVLPPTVVGFLLLLLLGKNSPIGQILHHLNLNIIFTWPSAVITSTVVAFPLMYRTSLGAFQQIENNIILAAKTLGASEWIIFTKVMIPLAYRGIVAATILAFARALGEFGATLMLAGNIPGQTQTMPLAIFFATESGDYPQAFLWVIILLFISLSVIIAVNFWAESKSERSQIKTQEKAQIIHNKTLNFYHHNNPENHNKLIVDIQKKYINFTLDITLENSQKPLGILGASGSGKSMTLRCIAGLETPDRGIITINDKILFDSVKKINLPSNQRQIGFVFQNYALFPHLTVRENIAFGLQKLPQKEQQKRINNKIAQMQLQDLENHYPHQLSGGQQQRVALARSLVIEPEILLLDEPFSALDTQLRNQMENYLLDILSNYTGITLMVSHNLEEIYRICQNLLVISEGKVLTCGDKEKIFAHPDIYEVAQLTGCKNFSLSKALSPYQIKALEWDCILNIIDPIPEHLKYVGIRAHQLQFMELENLKKHPEQNVENIFPCWLVHHSETPHRITLYLKLHQPPTQWNDYHLQVELFKENWLLLKDQPLPWHLRLDPKRLFLLE
jgi:molybdate ABC transporter permease protein